jgi:hypothetical protein
MAATPGQATDSAVRSEGSGSIEAHGSQQADIAALIGRLEKAMGPDRELDCTIYGTINWPKGKWEVIELGNADSCFSPEINFRWGLIRRTTDRHAIIYREHIPHYTSLGECSLHSYPSIQITSVVLLGDGRYEAQALDESGNYQKGEAATEAIARFIVAFKVNAGRRSPDTTSQNDGR